MGLIKAPAIKAGPEELEEWSGSIRGQCQMPDNIMAQDNNGSLKTKNNLPTTGSIYISSLFNSSLSLS